MAHNPKLLSPCQKALFHVDQFIHAHVLLALAVLYLRRPHCPQGPVKQSRYKRHSGLWECYYDGQTEEGGGEGERGKEGESKNIRGFLLKRRKSPLKGWHKVREGREGREGGREGKGGRRKREGGREGEAEIVL